MLTGIAEEQVLPRVVSRGFAVFDDGIYYLDLSVAHARARTEIRFYAFRSNADRAVISDIDAEPGLGLSVSPDRRTFLLTLWRNLENNLMLIENFR